MRRALLTGLVVVGCVRAPVVPTKAAAETKAAEESDRIVETPPEPEPEPAPVPSLVLVDEDWVWDDEDPSGPLLRIVELDASNPDDPTAVRALLGVLEPLMVCYERELGRRPGLPLTLRIRRVAPTETNAVGLTVEDDEREPTELPECAGRVLAKALPAQDRDPHGRYAVRFFPRRDQAPPLRLPDVDDGVVEREGGVCFTVHTNPCKPHKHCMGPTWERTRCRHPAERPGVAVRWAFGPASPEGQWPRTGVDLVGADDGLVWRTALEPDDAERVGSLHVDEARRHIDGFRSEALPGALQLALEPTRVVLADRAGVRVYDRRTGKRGFRHAPREPEAPRMFLDEGTFTARKGKLRCTGDAGRGAFATLCGDALLWFDGHALAVIGYGPPMTLRGQTTLSDDTSTRTGGAAKPKASLRVAGWRVVVEGRVFLE